MRQVKVREPHYQFHAQESGQDLIVIGKGRRAYLWVGPTAGNILGARNTVYTFSGTKTLRAFARAILAATEAGR